MPEVRIPLIPLGEFTNPWHYTRGRLHGNDGAKVEITLTLPDGVPLSTLRIQGFLGRSSSLWVQMYRTQKDDYTAPAVDQIVAQTITAPPPGIVNESIPLAPSGKNVVDNVIYNYSLSAVASTMGPTDYAFIGELALFY
jgi:hypothetical protein